MGEGPGGWEEESERKRPGEMGRDSGRLIAHRGRGRSELLTGVGGALGDGEVGAGAPRPALVVLLALPAVGPCRVVLTLTGQLAVVVHAHGGVEVAFAPGRERQEVIVSEAGLEVMEPLPTRVWGWWLRCHLQAPGEKADLQPRPQNPSSKCPGGGWLGF